MEAEGVASLILQTLNVCCIHPVQRDASHSSGTVTPADTRESSEVPDTESEISSGTSDIIHNLQSLRREINAEESSNFSSAEGEESGGGATEGRAYETGELRRRTGH